MIDKSKIGSYYQIIYNGTTFSGVITEGREEFYSLIGLDCFELTVETMISFLETMGIKVKSNWKITTIKNKYDAIIKGNN